MCLCQKTLLNTYKQVFKYMVKLTLLKTSVELLGTTSLTPSVARTPTTPHTTSQQDTTVNASMAPVRDRPWPPRTLYPLATLSQAMFCQFVYWSTTRWTRKQPERYRRQIDLVNYSTCAPPNLRPKN